MDFDRLTPDPLLEQGLQVLRDLLGTDWTITVQPGSQEVRSGNRHLDALVQVKADGDSVVAQLMVELAKDVSPRLVEEHLLPKLDLLRQVSHFTHLLVIAPWVPPRVQALLRENDIGYVDLTGNTSLRVPRPGIALFTHGQTRPPRSSPGGRTTPAGPRAGRLVRLLADVAPPYRGGELAEAAGLSLAYVSRLLDAFEEQLLIRRERRVVVHVDWPQLLRARAEHYKLLRHNPPVGMVAPNGIEAVLKTLRSMPAKRGEQVVLTGTYAAHKVAPLAAGGQLMLYHPAGAPGLADEIGDDLGLLRVSKGADVLLLRAHDPVVFERTVHDGGLRRVALSQLVLDCLSGPGRMPAEGEAVLSYMQDNIPLWRSSRLPS